MTTLAIATEARVILDGVSWQTFEGLLDDLGEHRKARVVEVDLTHPSLDKFPIYTALGVGEVWRLDGETLWFYQRSGNNYVAVDTSAVLPHVTPSDIAAFIARGRETDRQVLFDEVRASAQP